MNKSKGYLSGLWLFLILFVIFIIGNILIGLYLREFALYHELLDILIPVALVLILKKNPVLNTLKLNKGLNKESVINILILFITSFLLKYGINYFVLLTGLADPSEVTTKVVQLVPNLFVFFITVAVIPVFLEEFIIRGVTLNEFTDTSMWQGAVMTGILFGMMHVDLGQLGYTTVLGIIMGAIVITTGSLWGGILFHFLNNFFSFVVLSAIGIFNDGSLSDLMDSLSNAEASQATQALANNNLVLLLQGIMAVVSLAGGIMLTYSLIKKLQRDNGYVNDASVSWVRLFINIPFILILIVYISVNLVLVYL